MLSLPEKIHERLDGFFRRARARQATEVRWRRVSFEFPIERTALAGIKG